MSHTNSTANYNLPQFVGSDKPTWLTDVNGAMSAIDTQMKLNADTASTASTDATTAKNGIGTLSSLNTTVKTDLVSAVNEVNTNLNTVSGVASGASTTATNAKNEADGLADYLNINTFTDLTVTTNRGTISNSKMKSAVNTNGSLGKVYGIVDVNGAGGTSNLVVTLSDSGLRPASPITINSGVMFTSYTSGGFNYMEVADMTIATNGVVTISIPVSSATTIIRIMITPYVIFAQDFGD